MPGPCYNHLTLRGPRPARDEFFVEVEVIEDVDLLCAHPHVIDDDEIGEPWASGIVCAAHGHREEETTEFYFDTWSGLPDVWLESVAEFFPSLEFTVSFASPGNRYHGHLVARDGKVVENVLERLAPEPGACDLDALPTVRSVEVLRGLAELRLA